MKERQWNQGCETAFIKFAEGRDISSARSAGDYESFQYFCKGMMWDLSTIKYSEFLVDKLEDFKNTGLYKNGDVGFLQTHLEVCKAKGDLSESSDDRIVRALIWLHDPASPVNLLYEAKDNDKKVDMACRLAGIISSNKNALIPNTLNHIKNLDEPFIFAAYMCIRHILYSETASSILRMEDMIFRLEVVADGFSRRITEPKQIKEIVSSIKDLVTLRAELGKNYDKLYGSIQDNPEQRGNINIKRRKETVKRVKTFKDLVTLEEEIQNVEGSPAMQDWMKPKK